MTERTDNYPLISRISRRRSSRRVKLALLLVVGLMAAILPFGGAAHAQADDRGLQKSPDLERGPTSSGPIAAMTSGGHVVDGWCSLTEAVLNANSNSDVSGGDCSPGVPGVVDEIVLVAHLYSYSSAYLAGDNAVPLITDDLEIRSQYFGTPALITRSQAPGTDAFRLLQVDHGTSLTIRDVHISGGLSLDDGGAIAAGTASTLRIFGSRISDSEAAHSGGGIHAEYSSQLLLFDTVVTGNRAVGAKGGGIFALTVQFGSIHLSRTEVTGNTADTAGGAYLAIVDGSLAILGSRISDNEASLHGGGVMALSYALGAGSPPSSMRIMNSDITNNSTRWGTGGLEFSARNGHHRLQNVTISGNSTDCCPLGGSGLFVLGSSLASFELVHLTVTDNETTRASAVRIDPLPTVEMRGSIVAGNRQNPWPAGPSVPVDIDLASLDKVDFSVFGDDAITLVDSTGAVAVGPTNINAASDAPGGGVAMGDMLGPLTLSQAVPVSASHPPAASPVNPLLDAVTGCNAAGVWQDQHFAARGAVCDVGAVEAP